MALWKTAAVSSQLWAKFRLCSDVLCCVLLTLRHAHDEPTGELLRVYERCALRRRHEFVRWQDLHLLVHAVLAPTLTPTFASQSTSTSISTTVA